MNLSTESIRPLSYMFTNVNHKTSALCMLVSSSCADRWLGVICFWVLAVSWLVAGCCRWGERQASADPSTSPGVPAHPDGLVHGSCPDAHLHPGPHPCAHLHPHHPQICQRHHETDQGRQNEDSKPARVPTADFVCCGFSVFWSDVTFFCQEKGVSGENHSWEESNVQSYFWGG